MPSALSVGREVAELPRPITLSECVDDHLPVCAAVQPYVAVCDRDPSDQVSEHYHII
jgi:hypothetical protein